MRKNLRQGIYEVENKEKYKGAQNPRYLSSYEQHFFRWADMNKNVIEWASENIVIPYYDPTRGKKRRYMVDIWMKYIDRHGHTYTALIEIKPSAQCKPPNDTGRKKKKTLIHEQTTWLTNQAKWQAAEKYAHDRGWKWMIVTEKHLFG